jgi:16S rRNA (cytosine1402-N4)-methyltransferase
LLQESIEALAIIPGGIYIDGTFGRGGHSGEILKHLNQDGRLLVMDYDPEAIAVAHALDDARIMIHHGAFSDMKTVCEQYGWVGKVNGILLDLGVSSPQLDQAERGFSFMRDGPLDMRMNPTVGESVAEFLQTVSVEDLTKIIKDYGEERFAKRAATAICAARDDAPIATTLQLARIVDKAVPRHPKAKKHSATRTFQALRIHINDELGEVKKVLADIPGLLAPAGRSAIISFHSLEDRLVKQSFEKGTKGKEVPRHLPVMQDAIEEGALQWIQKKCKASEAELDQNIRARSAMLRVVAKR